MGFARLAFALVVAYLLASRLIADVYTLPVGASLHPTDVILALLLVAWFMWMVTDPQPFPNGVVALLGVALMVTVLVAPYVNAWSLSPFEADGAERGLVRAVLYAGLFIAGYHLASSRHRAVRILVVAVVATVFQAAVAVYEAVTGAPFEILGRIWQTVLEVDPRANRGVVVALQERLTGEARVSATAPHPLVLAGVLAVGVGICVAFYINSESRRIRVALIGAIALQLLAIGATNQRTGFVVLGALGIVVLFTQVRRLPSALPLVFATGVAGVAIAIFSPRTPRLILNFITGQQTDHNVAVRTSKYEALPELIERRPVIGGGFQTSDPSQIIFDNGYLTELVELGIVGLALLLGFLLVVAGRSFRAMRGAERVEQPILLSAVLALVCLLVTMITFDALSFVQLFPVCLLVLAVALGRADALRRQSSHDRRDHDVAA